MNPMNDPRNTELFVLGPTVISIESRRHQPRPPTEDELLRAELRRITERKSRRRRRDRGRGRDN